jgi:hypothetical protein
VQDDLDIEQDEGCRDVLRLGIQETNTTLQVELRSRNFDHPGKLDSYTFDAQAVQL